jgi:hypothetical protein
MALVWGVLPLGTASALPSPEAMPPVALLPRFGDALLEGLRKPYAATIPTTRAATTASATHSRRFQLHTAHHPKEKHRQPTRQPEQAGTCPDTSQLPAIGPSADADEPDPLHGTVTLPDRHAPACRPSRGGERGQSQSRPIQRRLASEQPSPFGGPPSSDGFWPKVGRARWWRSCSAAARWPGCWSFWRRARQYMLGDPPSGRSGWDAVGVGGQRGGRPPGGPGSRCRPAVRSSHAPSTRRHRVPHGGWYTRADRGRAHAHDRRRPAPAHRGMTGAAQWVPASAAGHLGGACSCASQAAPGRLPVVVADASIGSGASVLVGRSPPGRPRASGGRPLVPTDSGQVTQPTAAYAVQPQGDRHSQRWRRGVIPAKSRSSAPRRPDPARRTLAPAAISRPRPGPDPSWGVGRAATPRHHARAGASTSTSPPASPTTPPPARSSQRSLPGSPPNSPQRSQTSGKITNPAYPAQPRVPRAAGSAGHQGDRRQVHPGGHLRTRPARPRPARSAGARPSPLPQRVTSDGAAAIGQVGGQPPGCSWSRTGPRTGRSVRAPLAVWVNTR